MGYTVKQAAGMSGVSVRTLHFYDETGLLKPARHGANGYRVYDEQQLLTLQQILFYRELGFELKQIKGILDGPDFEKIGTLELAGEPNDCKVSARDTDGAMCVFEFTGGGCGESVFIPRKVPHVWACVSARPRRMINLYQPAGRMEDFFRELGRYDGKPYVHEALSFDAFCRLFHDYGMDVVGPPLKGEWKVEEDGRITQLA